MRPESKLQAKTMKYLASQGAYARKLSDRFTSGLPDIIGCWGGVLFAIELKSSGGVIKPLQRLEAAEIKHAGGMHAFCRTMDQVIIFFESVKEAAKQLPKRRTA